MIRSQVPHQEGPGRSRVPTSGCKSSIGDQSIGIHGNGIDRRQLILPACCLTAVQPCLRGRGIETPGQAEERGRYDVALVAVLSDGGLRRSEASSLTWGDVQRWDDGSGRITVIRSKTDVEAQGAVVAITPATMRVLDAIRPAGADNEVRVFGLSEPQIARWAKVILRPRVLPTGSYSIGTADFGYTFR